MKKYLIKETSVATKDNPSYAGDVSIGYYGKEEYQIANEGTHLNYNNLGERKLKDVSREWISKWAYCRAGDAKRSYIYQNPENTKFWKSTVEIIEVEV